MAVGEVLGNGLWVPKQINVARLRPVVRTVTLRNGERAKVTTEPTGHEGSSVTHIERADGVDAVVRPKHILLRVRGR